MNIVTPISKVPKELRGLWNLQYAPIERVLQEAFKNPTAIGKKNIKIYKDADVIKRICILDQLHMKATGATSMF